MTLIIDAQVLQTPDFYRGMGFYLRNLLREYGKIRVKEDKIYAILNKNLDNLDRSKKELRSCINDVRIVIADLGYKKTNGETFSEKRGKNAKIVDRIVDRIDGNDKIFFIPAIFANDIFPVFPSSEHIRKIALFHDLIPYLYSEKYFPDYSSKMCIDYCERFIEVYKTDLFVANSQTTADDLASYLGFSHNRLRPILGGGTDRSRLIPKKPEHVNGNFILMPSGDDHRKNNIRGVQAFAEAMKRVKNNKTKLVITSNFSNGTKSDLKKLSKNLIFTGNISDEEYLWLMNNTDFMFFPTEYEGLGMPVIEAVESGVKVVCTDIAVFREISATAFKFVDPNSVNDMADKIVDAVKSGEDWRINKKEYDRIRSKFNWEKTAHRFSESLDSIKEIPIRLEKPSLAILSPAVDSYSAIGKFVLECHAELAKRFNIDYYFERGQTVFDSTRLNILKYTNNSYEAVSFAPERYDHVLYHIGNSEFHINTIFNLLRYPGAMILHDSFLDGIHDYMERHGYMCSERRKAESVLTKYFADGRSDSIVGLLNKTNLAVCHSKYVDETISEISRKIKNKSTVLRTYHPIGVPKIDLKSSSNKKIVTFAGIISKNKGIDLIEKIANLDKDIVVRLIGYSALGEDSDLAKKENVEILHNLSDFEFQNKLRESDLVVNYRVNYKGETSRSVLESLRFGIPVIVKNIGWYAELPDYAVVKIDNEDAIIKEIKKMINNRWAHKNRSRVIGYMMNNFSYDKYADGLEKAITRSKN